MAVNFDDLDDGLDDDILNQTRGPQAATESSAQEVPSGAPSADGPEFSSLSATPDALGPSGDDLDWQLDEANRERSSVWIPPEGPRTASIPLLDDQWPEPVNVWDSSDTGGLAAVTEKMLPPEIAAYVFDQADRAGVDPNQVAVNCYTACAAMIRSGIGLQMQQDMGDGGRVWTEYAILWAAVVGMFSEKKGVGLDIAVDYLKAADTRQRIKEQAAWDQYEDQNKQHENDVKDYYRDRKKNPSAEKPEAPEKPPRSRLWTDDATLQSMAKLFSENPRGKISIIKDELSGWFGSFDAFTSGKSDIDRPAFLSFYESKQRLIDRVGSGFYAIDRWGGCILGGIQPDVLAKIASKLGGDGMLQRFQIITSKPARQVPRRPADKQATALWQKVQENLFQMEQRGNPVTLSPQAAEFMDDRIQWVNKALSSGLTPALAGALGKWEGLFGRLMITSHCIKAAAQARQGDIPVPWAEVDLKTAEQCWAWMHGLLWPHAIHFYTATMDKTDSNKHLLAFADFIIARDIQSVKPGYLTSQWTHYKRYLRTSQDRREFWNAVVNSGIALPSAAIDRTIQIAREYTVNPKFHDGRFAKYRIAAIDKRDRYREIMPESFSD